MCVLCAILTDVKQRRVLSPVAVSESQHVTVNPVTSVAVTQPQDPAVSTSAGEETLPVSGEPEPIKEAAASPLTENVNASMSQLSLTADVDSEADDTKTLQPTATKSDSADRDASVAPNDASSNDSKVCVTSVQPLGALVNEQTDQLPQQLSSNPQDADHREVPGETNRDSTYQTDIAVYKKEVRSADPAASRHKSNSASTSETFTSCVPSSPVGSESAFYSPQSDVSDNRNANNSAGPFERQGNQHSLEDTAASTPSGPKVVVYRRSDSETRPAVDDRTQNVSVAEKRNEDVAQDHHDEVSKDIKSEELVEPKDNVDQDSDADDDLNDDNDEGKVQDEGASDEKMTAVSRDDKTKGKKKGKKRKKKKNDKQLAKQTQSATVAESVSSSNLTGDDKHIEVDTSEHRAHEEGTGVEQMPVNGGRNERKVSTSAEANKVTKVQEKQSKEQRKKAQSGAAADSGSSSSSVVAKTEHTPTVASPMKTARQNENNTEKSPQIKRPPPSQSDSSKVSTSAGANKVTEVQEKQSKEQHNKAQSGTAVESGSSSSVVVTLERIDSPTVPSPKKTEREREKKTAQTDTRKENMTAGTDVSTKASGSSDAVIDKGSFTLIDTDGEKPVQTDAGAGTEVCAHFIFIHVVFVSVYCHSIVFLCRMNCPDYPGIIVYQAVR